MLDPEGQALRDEMLGIIGGEGQELSDDAAFSELALRVFDYNVRHVPPYAAYCRARGAEPGTVHHWTRIPAVPTAAFKEVKLLAAGATAERVFRTSGTTRGPERRGEHHVADLGLYRASLRAGFHAHLLPDDADLVFLSLVPPADAAPDSSLAFMVDDVLRTWGGEGSASFATASGVDFPGLDEAVAAAVADARPVLLLGTSAAFIHWLDRLAEGGVRHALPDGSRVMDTGGYKGAGRQVEPDELRSRYRARLGLPPHRCVNEYGMTEMLSQYYDSVLRDHHAGRARRPTKVAPPWVRSMAVDPETLAPMAPGRSGLLRHLDLANLGSVAAVQTEDFGRVDEDGMALEGRAAGAQPRGCSIAMDLLLGGSS